MHILCIRMDGCRSCLFVVSFHCGVCFIPSFPTLSNTCEGSEDAAYPRDYPVSILSSLHKLLFSFIRAMSCDHDNTTRTIAKNVLTDAFRDDPSDLSFSLFPSSVRTRPSR